MSGFKICVKNLLRIPGHYKNIKQKPRAVIMLRSEYRKFALCILSSKTSLNCIATLILKLVLENNLRKRELIIR